MVIYFNMYYQIYFKWSRKILHHFIELTKQVIWNRYEKKDWHTDDTRPKTTCRIFYCGYKHGKRQLRPGSIPRGQQCWWKILISKYHWTFYRNFSHFARIGIDSTDDEVQHVTFIGCRAIDDLNCVLWFHSRMVDEIAHDAVILES